MERIGSSSDSGRLTHNDSDGEEYGADTTTIVACLPSKWSGSKSYYSSVDKTAATTAMIVEEIVAVTVAAVCFDVGK